FALGVPALDVGVRIEKQIGLVALFVHRERIHLALMFGDEEPIHPRRSAHPEWIAKVQFWIGSHNAIGMWRLRRTGDFRDGPRDPRGDAARLLLFALFCLSLVWIRTNLARPRQQRCCEGAQREQPDAIS